MGSVCGNLSLRVWRWWGYRWKLLPVVLNQPGALPGRIWRTGSEFMKEYYWDCCWRNATKPANQPSFDILAGLWNTRNRIKPSWKTANVYSILYVLMKYEYCFFFIILQTFCRLCVFVIHLLIPLWTLAIARLSQFGWPPSALSESTVRWTGPGSRLLSSGHESWS